MQCTQSGFGQVVALEGDRKVFVVDALRGLAHARDQQHRDSVAQIDEGWADDFVEFRLRRGALERLRCRERGGRVLKMFRLNPFCRFDLGSKESSDWAWIRLFDSRNLRRILDRENCGIENQRFSHGIFDRCSEDSLRLRDRSHQR